MTHESINAEAKRFPLKSIDDRHSTYSTPSWFPSMKSQSVLASFQHNPYKYVSFTRRRGLVREDDSDKMGGGFDRSMISTVSCCKTLKPNDSHLFPPPVPL
jgi:hypothetical protein